MPSPDPVADTEWGVCWLEPGPMPAELAAEVRRLTGGIVPAWATHTASVPWVARATGLVTRKHVAYMPLDLFGLIALVVSQDNSCRYCYGATRTLLSVFGYSDEQIDRIARDVHLSDLTRPEQVALEFARKVSHANPRATAFDRDALTRVGYSPPVIAEIAYMAAFQGFPNRIATFLALPSERFFRIIGHPLARIVRPLIARALRGKHAAPEATPAGAGPIAEIIAGLGDSPTARTVRTLVDDAFASPVLPRRTKLLMFAVIGRALGCDHSEDEARSSLADDGLGAADVDEILANLGSPKLDRRDALLVPFARETVRYQTGPIQRRTRDLARELPIEEVIEAVGIAALANSLARLSVLLETC